MPFCNIFGGEEVCTKELEDLLIFGERRRIVGKERRILDKGR